MTFPAAKPVPPFQCAGICTKKIIRIPIPRPPADQAWGDWNTGLTESVAALQRHTDQ